VAENGAPKRMRRSVEAKAVDYLEIVLDDQNDTQVTVTEATEPTVTQSPPPIKESSPPAPVMTPSAFLNYATFTLIISFNLVKICFILNYNK
jgi:hypothetical protein